MSLLMGDAAKAPVRAPLGFNFRTADNGTLVPKCPENLDMLPLRGGKSGVCRYGCPRVEVNAEGKKVCTCQNPCSKAKAGRTLTISIPPDLPFGECEADADPCAGKYHLDRDGRPRCKAGLSMSPNGSDPERGLAKFRCPRMEKDAEGNLACTCSTPCSTAKYGKNVCIPFTENLRLLNPVQRGTQEWVENYNRRTASERLNKCLKIDLLLEALTCRNTKMCYIQVYTVSILQHLIAQSKVIRENPGLDRIPELARALGVKRWHYPGGYVARL